MNVQLVQIGTNVLEPTIKTAAGSQRVVPLGDRAVAALITWQLSQMSERDAAGVAWVDSGRVFTMSDGRQLRPAYASRLFDTIQDGIGLPRQRFHDLRHLFASLALSSGEDMGVVSKLMGHSTSVITRDLYAHLVGDRARQVVPGVADLLSPDSRVLTGVLTGNK